MQEREESKSKRQREGLNAEGWQVNSRTYVLGYMCSCGKLYPDRSPYMPYPPAPSVCPACGAPQNTWEKRSLLRIWYKRRRWFWMEERVVYECGKSWYKGTVEE